MAKLLRPINKGAGLLYSFLSVKDWSKDDVIIPQVKPTLSPEDPGDEVVGEPKVGLSYLEDDGSENVAKKMILRSFKVNRVYLDPLNMLNTVEFLRILFKFKKRKENSSSCVHVLHKTSN